MSERPDWQSSSTEPGLQTICHRRNDLRTVVIGGRFCLSAAFGSKPIDDNAPDLPAASSSASRRLCQHSDTADWYANRNAFRSSANSCCNRVLDVQVRTWKCHLPYLEKRSNREPRRFEETRNHNEFHP